MKTIRLTLLLLLLTIFPVRSKAQISDWIVDQIVDQIVGNIIDGIAESIGRSAASSASNQVIKNDIFVSSQYEKDIENLTLESRKNAFNAMTNDGAKFSKSMADKDLQETYSGIFVDENLQKAIKKLLEKNNQVIDTLSILAKSKDAYHKILDLKKLIGDDSFRVWAENSHSSKDLSQLYDDISGHARLLSLFRTVPQSMHIYNKVLHTSLREDANFLYYVSRKADSFQQVWDSLYNEEPLLHVENLVAKESSDGPCLIDEKSHQNHCIVKRQPDESYVIECHTEEFLDLCPIGNACISLNNIRWETDRFGRPIKSTVSLSRVPNTKKNIKAKAKMLMYVKSNFNSQAIYTGIGSKGDKEKHVDFYLTPLSLGGNVNYINYLSLTSKRAKNSELKKLDKQILKLLKKGIAVNREISISYIDATSFEPETISVKATSNGRSTTCSF